MSKLSSLAGLEKTRVFKKKKPAQWVFLGFLFFFLVFWVFFCPDERVFRVFFSFTNTFYFSF